MDDQTLQLVPRRSLGTWVLVALVLAAACLMMRAVGVMTLPIFGDEAIYLQLERNFVREKRKEGLKDAHLWVSLADPKPPLHYWLMALVLNWTTDPLLAARWISVLSGVLGVPLAMLIGNECGFLIRIPETRTGQAMTPTGRTLGLIAALLMIFCPFLSFYQRLATADALFVGESLAIVWLALRWGRLAAGAGNLPGLAGTQASVWTTAIALGVAIGLGLMTRQGISYTLCVMPVIAWLLHATAGHSQPPPTQSVSQEPAAQTRPRMLSGDRSYSCALPPRSLGRSGRPIFSRS